MSDWKNPSFPSERSGRKVEWKAPAVEEVNTPPPMAGVAIIVKALLGFLVIASVNAVALMLVSLILGIDLEYRRAVAIGGLYILWRAYDNTVFSRLLKDR
jgi:hypothetical protein